VVNHSAASFPETTGLSSLGLFPLGMEEPYGADDHPLWAWVSGGACAVEAGSVLKWFTVLSGKGPRGPEGPGVPVGDLGRSGAWDVT
jgi:tectonin beta-propeller repeat-containing protein 1